MSRAALPPPSNPNLLDGAALLEHLRHGWSPLPARTVMAMALGGLRVRMMRSLITTLSVVLAIAFLSYTGLTNQLTHNLAKYIQNLEREPPVDIARVAVSCKALAVTDPLPGLSRRSQCRLAVAMGMDEVFAKERELSRLGKQLRRERAELKQLQEIVEQLSATLVRLGTKADKLESDRIADELAKTRVRIEQFTDALTPTVSAHDVLEGEVALGKWIAAGAPDRDGAVAVATALSPALRQQQQRLLKLAATPSRLSRPDLRALSALLPVLSEHDPQHAPPLADLIDQELRKRAASDLGEWMRRAGVETNLAGNPLDTWLIVMALITCAVGITNAMLMSVTERIREIGTMKCLGAQDGLVVKLFLLESGLLGVVGAALGIVVGVAVALAAGVLQFHRFGLTHFPLVQAGSVIFWSMVSGIFLAVTATVYPAFTAARMRPVDALRVDE